MATLSVVAGSAVTGSIAVDQAVNNFGDTREGALAGPLGLVVVVLLGIATWLLYRNMSKRIKRLPMSFDSAELSTDVDAATRSGKDRPADVTATEVTPTEMTPTEMTPTEMTPTDTTSDDHGAGNSQTATSRAKEK